MNARDFCFWLMGYIEINDKGPIVYAKSLTADQVECVRRHLALVFKHDIDPSTGGDQEELQAIHDGKPSNPGDFVMRC